MTKLTVKAIASHFNVSVSTVSKAIHDSHEISDELKRNIREYAKLNNYKPNRVALNLFNRNTKTIGVVIPNILNYFFVQVLYGIEKIADQRGYSIIICSTNESIEKEIKVLDFLSSGTVDGVIISTVLGETGLTDSNEHFSALLDRQIPMVMFDRVIEFIECDKVMVDDFEAGYLATKYFLDTGCKIVAIINPIGNSYIGRLRIEGYKKALCENGIGPNDKLIVTINYQDDLELTIHSLLDFDKIDGILIFDELTLVKVMDIVQSKGYQIPKNISFIGFTNGELSKYVTPSATTVSQHGKFIGESSADKLIDRIEEECDTCNFETRIIKTSLIARESTLKPKEYGKA